MASSSIFGSTTLSNVSLASSNLASSAVARPSGLSIIPDIVFPGPVFQPTFPTKFGPNKAMPQPPERSTVLWANT